MSTAHFYLYKHFITVLCNADTAIDFQPARDVSLPEIYLPIGTLGAPRLGQPPNNRSILAFFAGGHHGDARKILFQLWKDKDNEVQVYGYLPKGLNYTKFMTQAKYFLCPSGYEVASPRVVDAIYGGCVPVIISDSYVLPLSDVLDWNQFSLHVPISKIPQPKMILKGISMEEHLEKQNTVVQVQRYFVLNRSARPLDEMPMVMHSVWLRLSLLYM